MLKPSKLRDVRFEQPLEGFFQLHIFACQDFQNLELKISLDQHFKNSQVEISISCLKINQIFFKFDFSTRAESG